MGLTWGTRGTQAALDEIFSKYQILVILDPKSLPILVACRETAKTPKTFPPRCVIVTQNYVTGHISKMLLVMPITDSATNHCGWIQGGHKDTGQNSNHC